MPAVMGIAGVQTLGMVVVCKEERATPPDLRTLGWIGR